METTPKSEFSNLFNNFEQVKSFLEELYSQTKPVCVFLYGSSASGDTVSGQSDFEVGVVYQEAKKVSRRDLAKMHEISNLSLYPFAVEDLQKGFVDTVFPQKIYLYQLILSSKTIFGEDIFKAFELPQLTLLDTFERSSFDSGVALAAHVNYRDTSPKSAISNFVKSCLFCAQCWIITRIGKFPTSYKQIVKIAIENQEDLQLSEEEVNLIKDAYSVRNSKKVLNHSMIFDNLKFVNRIKNELLAELNKGNHDINLVL